MNYLREKKPRQYSTFQFVADTIDGKILEFPQTFQLRCDLVVPLYQDVVRQFDGNECIVARRVYLIFYQGQVLGSKQFTTMPQFVNYRNSNCGIEANVCNVSFFGCPVTFNGCQVVIPK